MHKTYQIYLISDSTGETLDRIFLAIKAQFDNFECNTTHYAFTRTENQINKILKIEKILFLSRINFLKLEMGLYLRLYGNLKILMKMTRK